MRRHLSHIPALVAFVGLLGAVMVAHSATSSGASLPPGSIDTLAGGGTLTGDGIPATSAALGLPWGIAVNSAGAVFFGFFFWRVNKWRKNGKSS